MRTFAFCCAVLFSCSVSANRLVLPESHSGELRQQIQSSWQQCGESIWCEDDLSYYHDRFVAEASLSQDSLHIELIGEYSPERLGQIQLHLRQDGFSLQHAQIEGELFEVAKEIKSTSVEDVDRSLIVFLNRFPQHAHRTLIWQNGEWRARLSSDGELITLTLSQD